MSNLKTQELKKLKELAKRGDYDAVVALLDIRLTEQVNKLITITTDHRFNQGAIKALQDLRDDIVLHD